jgi:hypothetical protein
MKSKAILILIAAVIFLSFTIVNVSPKKVTKVNNQPTAEDISGGFMVEDPIL